MTSFAPLRPRIQVPPTKVAQDTYVIHSVQEALGQPLFVYLNSMVILGSEPLILDNLVSEVEPASRRDDLVPVFSFNAEGLWAGGRAARGDPTARLSRWRDLLSRLAKEGFE